MRCLLIWAAGSTCSICRLFKGSDVGSSARFRLDAATLGLDHSTGGLSVRVGKEADLRIVLADGASRVLHGGETLATLETHEVVSMEVKR